MHQDAEESGKPLRFLLNAKKSPTQYKMTTQLRTVSQIPTQVKYLYSVGSTAAWVPNTTTKVTAVMPYSDLASKFTSITDISANELMRDMGKSVMFTNANGTHYVLMRLVQLVDGPTTEGVPADWDTNGQFYVCTWSSDPATINVTVSRTG